MKKYIFIIELFYFRYIIIKNNHFDRKFFNRLALVNLTEPLFFKYAKLKS